MSVAAPFSLEATLRRAEHQLSDLRDALADRPRVDVLGLPPGALAYALASEPRPTVIVVADAAVGQRLVRDLRFFSSEPDEVLYYPASDITPYLAVAPDRRAAMDRLAVLFHLSAGLSFRQLVVPAAAFIRKVPPVDGITRRSTVIETESEMDRAELISLLDSGGYLRVPVAEDAGTYAIRGSVIDVYPPHAAHPARIELDDWLVTSIKLFDADNQRTVGKTDRLLIHPVRDIPADDNAIDRARARVRDLCDAIDMPTSETHKLIDELESGRAFYGIDGFLPAFYDRLSDLRDYLPSEALFCFLDPTAVVREVDEELDRAATDLEARRRERKPAYDLEAHYLEPTRLATELAEQRLLAVHRLAVGGTADEDFESPLSFLESVPEDARLGLGADDHRELGTALKNRRGSQTSDALKPLADRTQGWLDAGLRVFFAARTQTQAARLTKVLRAYGIELSGKARPFDPARLADASAGTARVVIGELSDGFLLAREGLVFVSEEEVFGTRTQRREKRRKSRDQSQPFLEDLRELKVGDYVVHIDHGIGRYRGLERKPLGQSALDRMQGKAAPEVEVLLVEYAGGDKLFLPVTRLNQIQKLSGKEGKTPKLDKLGGQTFAKTKAKVKKRVRQMAEELLNLYAKRAALTREALPTAGREYEEFEATFPFDETPDQGRAIDDVLKDLEKPRPMDRVVCGDVGFGKTEVALRGAFRCAMAGRQVALLCPTTVLAQQHFQTFQARLAAYPLEVRVLSRFVDRSAQTETIKGLKEGTVDVVVGTHRLLSKDVHFKQLGLLVVDEEQRFGVAHKERIKKLRTEVDVLTLSATPIPRTLQMAVGGLRDLSLITTPPTDRRAVRTFASRWDEHVIREAILRELDRGGQVFFVYNRVEGLYERGTILQKLVPDARIAVGHGQLKPVALEKIMTGFIGGDFDILCSTAIVESGLDIPRANTMIIDRADMFGLAQLYQLRGRVGRSKERAYCYLITPPPTALSDEARYRIEALERFTELGSGFQVASLDMEQRGAGDLLGVEQSGAVAQIGLDLFLHMLQEAVAQLKGEPLVAEVDPEMSFDLEWYLPDDYIEDVGLRLSFYKRFAGAASEAEVTELGEEMEDRFGAPPPQARLLVRAMSLKPALRKLRALGCEANPNRVTLHLSQDTPVDPQKLMPIVASDRAHWKVTPDMRLTRRFDDEKKHDSITRVETLLKELDPLLSTRPQ
ncbi:MAG: transcription-repair coupling factor [Myxococcota bacterium]